MNRSEHLLLILSEECNEIAQRVSKALRFGLGEIQAEQDLNNTQRIRVEINDFLGVLEMLTDDYVFRGPIADRQMMDAKKAKVEKFFAISRDNGRLIE